MASRTVVKNPKAQSEKHAKPAAGSDAMLKRLERHMRESILPGETPLAGKASSEAAAFLLKTAQRRDAGRSALALISVSEERRFLRIAIVNDDMPFLVDSIAATIAAQGIAIDQLVHPVIFVSRDASGELTRLGSAADKGRESMIYIETERVDARQRRALENALRTTLGDIRAAVADWPALQARMIEDSGRVSSPENAQLLRWLNDGMLTQLGHLTRKRDGSQSDLLGVCRKSARQLLADASHDRAFAWFDGQAGRDLLIVKANIIANVHRRVPLDLFIVPIRIRGKVTALSIHAGVWTSAALASPPQAVPRLRQALHALGERLGFTQGGHASKALIHALTALPHDLLIGFDDASVERVSTAMMSLVDRPRPRLVTVEAPLARHMFVFVWFPRDLLATQVRLQIHAMLEEHDGTEVLDWGLEVEGGNLAMLRFVLDIRNASAPLDEDKLEARLQDMLRGWGEAVEKQLGHYEEPARAAALAARYAHAFPQAYRAEHGAAAAAADILRLRGLAGDEARDRDARLYRLAGDRADCLRMKIYQRLGALPLSDAVPALENFGFRVLTEVPTSLDHGRLGTIHDFTLALPEGDAADALLERADAIESAIACVLNGQSEDDPFNRLIAGTGLSARQADWLRAFYRYLRQTGLSFTIYTVVDALRGAPQVTRALVDLFIARHDPDFAGSRDAAAMEATATLRRGLANVAAINDDRLLRLYHALVKAILRTNAFAAAGPKGEERALAFKIDSALVPNLPKPVPWREIWVYSRRVEGIHLRAGPVARGGLRWSDRRDDFRTEILGLMKAQRVKNAVIVPTGAKGGFYPKQLPSPARDRDGWAAEGQASYEVFIRTLLSLTDNIVDGKVVHPERVVILDGEDPYFVVAADKGTARFSDVANGIAQKADFWLDDAFASGGSHGYDHKAMAITARGAWLSVQRHFLEMGVDVQKDAVRVVGCGDMSGDVFGNGMLLSKAIALIAAFDHRHIFIDPDPDPAKSWAERKRLYDLPRSSWGDYDASLISRGGGVWSRDAKTIKLSKRACEALGLVHAEFEPDALIGAILKANVDLVWFGGIGTYIKSEAENNVQVGDPANDALRVNAGDVRAKVIGEGANLGVTQAGRIAFALGGGRINTDFIDNSAGVDCSDNEVNIKIALAAATRTGQLSAKRRNALLVEMTDEVAAIVLEDNRLQALALSIAEAGGPRTSGAHMRLIERLEEAGSLDRRTEGLADSETYARRASEGHGLTRPELAVLLSSAKLALQDAIEKSKLVKDSALEPLLIGAFPQPMRKAFHKQLVSHQLRGEIIATKLANRVVNRLGLIHSFELAEEEGVGLAQIASAFVGVERLLDLETLWHSIETAKMPEKARLLLLERAAAAISSHMADLLRQSGGTLAPSEAITALAPAVADLSGAAEKLLSAPIRARFTQLQAQFVEVGAPANLAAKVVHLFEIDGSIGLAGLARESGIKPELVASAFIDLGARLGLDWAQQTSEGMAPSDPWERVLVNGLARDFQHMRIDFLRRCCNRKGALMTSVEQWAQVNAISVAQFAATIARAQAQTPAAPAMLAQIAIQARNLLER